MAGGVFAVARGIFDHPFFAPEPFTEREAWLWLVENAAWKDTRVRVRNGARDLTRGQLAFATRFMAQRWGWSEARVRRFLARLKIDAMIDAQTDAQTTLITICNYDAYQFSKSDSDAQTDAPRDAQSTRARRKEEEDNNRSSSLRSEDSPSELESSDVEEALSGYLAMAKSVGLPTVRSLTPARRKKLSAIIRQHGLPVWAEALAKVAASPFCIGQNDRGWRVDLDFMLTPSKLTSVLEGKYDPVSPQARGSPRSVSDLARSLAQSGTSNDRPPAHLGNDRPAAQQLPAPSGRFAGDGTERLPDGDRGSTGERH